MIGVSHPLRRAHDRVPAHHRRSSRSAAPTTSWSWAAASSPTTTCRSSRRCGVSEMMLQDTPPDAIVAMIRRVVAGARTALMEAWSLSSALRRGLPAAARFALLVPAPRDDAGRRARRRDPRAAEASHALRVGPRAVLPAQVGRGRLPPRPPAHRSRTSRRACRSSPSRTCAPRRRKYPPFGDYLCVPESEIHHIHGTSGTTGRPTAFGISRDDWDAIANAHARIMWGMGIRPGDTVFIAAIFSLYIGSWGTLAGAERLRAKAFPFGAGAPGMTARAAMWLDAHEARGVLRHAVVRAASRRGRARGRLRPAPLRPQDAVLLRRARRLGARRPRQDRRSRTTRT